MDPYRLRWCTLACSGASSDAIDLSVINHHHSTCPNVAMSGHYRTSYFPSCNIVVTRWPRFVASTSDGQLYSKPWSWISIDATIRPADLACVGRDEELVVYRYSCDLDGDVL
jgi:hypothetical protein